MELCYRDRGETLELCYNANSTAAQQKWEPQSSGSHLPNITIIAQETSYFHSHFIQSLPFFLMEHPILQMGKSWGIMKIQKRSESNVLIISQYKKARLTTDGTHL